MKKYIAMGLTMIMLMGAVGCTNNQTTDETDIDTNATTEHVHDENCGHVIEETVFTNAEGQLLYENGNVIETQAVVDEHGHTKVVDNQGNEIVKNSDGSVAKKKVVTQTVAKTTAKSNIDSGGGSGNNYNNTTKKQTAAPVAQQTTRAPQTQAPVYTPTTKQTQAPATTKATTAKPTTKATTKATTVKKQQSYYVCNGCGYSVTVANGGRAKIDSHQESRMIAGHFECSGYKSVWK